MWITSVDLVPWPSAALVWLLTGERALFRAPSSARRISVTERQYTCPAGHSFDVAKEGYVNLLCTSKSADKMGDSKESAAARHAFLERRYYGCLKEALTPLLHGNVLDICCGEGYYDSVPADGALYGLICLLLEDDGAPGG